MPTLRARGHVFVDKIQLYIPKDKRYLAVAYYILDPDDRRRLSRKLIEFLENEMEKNHREALEKAKIALRNALLIEI